MAKKVLVVSSGHGYWGEELVGPLEALDAAGYQTEFVTPKSTKPAALPPSMDNEYIDSPLGCPVTTKPIAAECYGVACLAFARDVEDRRSIIRNKRVTGHCLECDYKDGAGFLGTGFNMDPPPYPLEYIPRDALAPKGAYHGNFAKEISVIVDYPFITGRSTADSTTTRRKLVDVLENGLRRCGW